MSSPSNSILGKIKDGFLAFVKDGLAVVEKVLPFVSPFLPTGVISAITAGTGDLEAIATIITGVEATSAAAGAPGLTAAQKLAAATPGAVRILQAFATSKLPGANKILDQAAFTAGAQQVISGMVTLMNAVGE